MQIPILSECVWHKFTIYKLSVDCAVHQLPMSEEIIHLLMELHKLEGPSQASAGNREVTEIDICT